MPEHQRVMPGLPCEDYAAARARGRRDGAHALQQAYDRGMAKTQDSVEQDVHPAIQPLPGALNLLDDDAAGYCSGGVCHFPAPKTQP